jgi:hypothetical protein
MAYPKPWQIILSRNYTVDERMLSNAVGNLKSENIDVNNLWWEYAKKASNYQEIRKQAVAFGDGFRVMQKILMRIFGLGCVNFGFVSGMLVSLLRQGSESDSVLSFHGDDEKHIVGYKDDDVNGVSDGVFFRITSGRKRRFEVLFPFIKTISHGGRYTLRYKIIATTGKPGQLEFHVLDAAGKRHLLSKPNPGKSARQSVDFILSDELNSGLALLVSAENVQEIAIDYIEIS